MRDHNSYPMLSPHQLASLRSKVYLWESFNQKAYPWHNCGNAYWILVAEVLVRKSRAIDALPVYEKIINKYPTIRAMARSNVEDLYSIIRPLGLYNRARTLREAARLAIDSYDGEIPTDPGVLMKWKGIGRYTANAVVCLAFDVPVPMVDESVGRLIRRVVGVSKGATANSDKELWEWAEKIVPENNCKEFNLALIQIGKDLCKPRRPMCNACPIKELCASSSVGEE